MAEISRRSVLIAGAGVIGIATLGLDPASADAASTAARASVPLRANYSKSVGKTFVLERAGHIYKVRLSGLRDLAPTTAAQRPHCFNLIFTPTGGARLRDGIYAITRAGVPTHSLFVSSLGTAGQMQALVNRPG